MIFEILNYMITSNHVHLLLVDDGDREVISNSMQLVAQRTGQEYNERKDRRGTYWEDRYHATAIKSGIHLAQCLVYMETNMVRAGVVEHPSMWSFSGYNEIQEPRRKKVLIDYEKLQSYVVAVSYEQLKRNHRGWVEDCLGNGEKPRHEKWTRSIAVGGKSFVNNVKTLLGVRARGKEVIEGDEGYQLREGSEVYDAHFEPENRNIGLENSYFWGVNHE